MPTKTEVDNAVYQARGQSFFAEYAFTQAMSTSFATIVPVTNYSTSFTGSSDFTMDATTGEVTCNFDGTIECSACGSFSLTGSAVAEGHWYVKEVDQLQGFRRNVINANQFGSFCAPSGSLTVSNGDKITFRCNVSTGTPTITFHDLRLSVDRKISA